MINFTTSFQTRLLALLCLDKEFFLAQAQHLEGLYFTTFIGKWLFEYIRGHYAQYNELPTLPVIENEINTQSPDILPEEQAGLQEFFSIITSGAVTEADYIRTTITKFISNRRLRLALSEHNDDIEAGNIEVLLDALKKIQPIEKVGGLSDIYTFSLLNLGEIYESVGACLTGIPLIDNYVGGLFNKELTLFMADTNVGKSLMLTYIGGRLLRQKKRVLHVTLEMSAARTLLRYMTTLLDETPLNYNNLIACNPLPAVFEYVLTLRERYEPYMFLEELPTGRGSINDIEKMIQKHSPQVLIVDYLDLIKPAKVREHKRFELGDITVQLRGLASLYGIPIVTATQTSRQAANRRIVGKEFVAEDYEKIRVSDVVVGMGQSQQDSLQREVVLNLTKSRNTEKGRLERYLIDYNTLRFVMQRAEILGSGDTA